MLLVLFAIAVASVLAITFLEGQTTSLGVARNIDRHARARGIAESGIDLAVAAIHADSGWRNTFTHGLWIADKPLDGGSVTVNGYDGPVNDDGSIGDGVDTDLADNPQDPVTIVAVGRYAGVTHIVTRTIVPSVSGGGAVAASSLALSTTVELTGSAEIDSWDSSQGSYWSTRGSSAQVITNSTANSAVRLTGNPQIKGSVTIGPGGSLDKVIEVPSWKHDAITGQRIVAEEPATIPMPAEPTNVGPYSGKDKKYTGAGAETLSQNLHVDDFTITGSRTLTIEGDVTILCRGDFTVSGSASIKLAVGASLSIYVYGDIEITGSGTFNTNTGDPSRLQIFALDDGDIDVTGSGVLYARIVAPNAPLSITGSAEVYGAYLGQSLSLTGNARFHQDLAEMTSTGGGGGSGGSGTYTSRWIEMF